MKLIKATKKEFRSIVLAMEMTYTEFDLASDGDRAKWARKLVRAISKCQRTRYTEWVSVNEDFARWESIDKCKRAIREYKLDLACVG